MKSKDRIILQKIVNYISEIENYIEGLLTKTFMEDKKTITACAFTVSQIGELTKSKLATVKRQVLFANLLLTSAIL